MKKVVVTGANGFLGSWITKALVKEGHQVVALVRKNSDLTELQGVSCEFFNGDVTDLNSLRACFQGADSVFHLAGLIAYRKSQRSIMDKVNVEGTRNVVQACTETKVHRLVYLSSVVAVGASFEPTQVLNEDSPYDIHELNLGYFETKHRAEQIVLEACREKMINAVILCPSTIYGAGDAKKGSRKMQIKVAQGRLRFYTSGGVNVVSVEDVVAGVLSAWKKGQSGERYILAGENILIKDLFRLIAEEAGVTAPSHLLPNVVLHGVGILGDLLERFGVKGPLSRENAYTATLYHWFDSSKAKKELGFTARPAKEAIKNSVQWMKENKVI